MIYRHEKIVPNLYYRWSKDFLEAGEKRLLENAVREANNNKISGLRQETVQFLHSLPIRY